MKRILLSVASCALLVATYAQSESNPVTKLTLDDCISTGLERNITLKQARNNEIIAESNRFQSIMNFFPTLSAGINYDYFFGNFFDTNAARQVSATTNSSNPNLSSNLVLFNGLSNHFQYNRRTQELIAAEENTKNTSQSIESLILSSYLKVMLDIENVKIAREQVDLLSAQLEREKKRETVGVGNLESVFNFQGQLANQKLTLVNLENTLKRDQLTLFQTLNLDMSNSQYEVEPYMVDEAELLMEQETYQEVLHDVIGNSPALKAAKASYEASRFQLRSARAQRGPTLAAYGRVGSNYSSNGARNPSTGEYEPNATFSEQLQYNEFEYVNFSLSIPIFNGYKTSNSIQTAKVNLANSELAVDNAFNTMTNLVQSAYLDLISAQQSYKSAKENLETATQSFEFMKKRFETGNTDFYTYLQSLNNKNRAELELVNAKYSIVFRKKILELYRGQSSVE